MALLYGFRSSIPQKLPRHFAAWKKQQFRSGTTWVLLSSVFIHQFPYIYNIYCNYLLSLSPHCLGSLAGVILSCHDWSLLCLTGLGDDFMFDFTNLFTLKTCWVSQLCPGEPREGPVASKLQVEVHDAEPKAPETKAAMAVPAVPKPPTVSCREVHFHWNSTKVACGSRAKVHFGQCFAI